MRPVDLEALVAHRLQKSEEALQAARVMIDQKMFSFAMNRIYYSVSYGVQALLAHKEVAFSKHGQVKGYFNREFIKTGILPKEIGRFYNRAFEYRQKFDYVDFLAPDQAMVAEYVETAENVVSQIRQYLVKEPP